MNVIKDLKAVYKYSSRPIVDKKKETMEKSLVFLSFAIMVMTLINVWEQTMLMALSTLGLCLGCGLCYFVSNKWQKPKLAVAIFSFAMIIVYSYYFLYGSNDGVASLWMLVFPYLSFSIIGLRYGLWTGAYFFVLLSAFCWSPLRGVLPYEYNETFLSSFPFLYAFSLMIAVWTTLQVQTAEIEREQKIIDLNEAVEGERKRNLQIAMQTIISICHAVEAKDPYTNEHSLRVARYVKMIAQELGWDEEKQRNIYVASLMHDIGKIGVPDEILKKPDHLTDEESKIIKRHPEIGYSIMKDFNAIENAAEGVLYHHERYDGKGYPRQLKGEQIPLYGRIIAVADAFDAMNSNRIYRQAGQKEYIVEQIRNGIGTQFDPKIAEIFLKLIEEGKITFWEEDEKNIDF